MDYRDRDRDRDRNRGMFGYEGEGYMAQRDERDDYDEFARRGYGRGDYERSDRMRDDSYRGGGYMGGDWNSSMRNRDDRDYMTRGYQDLESGADRGWNVGRDSDRGDYGAGTQRQSYRGRGPKNYQRSDERIREDVCERLAMDDDVDASEIEVMVSGAVVTLDGSVAERHAKRLAEDIAESVRGVKDVQNNVRVTR